MTDVSRGLRGSCSGQNKNKNDTAGENSHDASGIVTARRLASCRFQNSTAHMAKTTDITVRSGAAGAFRSRIGPFEVARLTTLYRYQWPHRTSQLRSYFRVAFILNSRISNPGGSAINRNAEKPKFHKRRVVTKLPRTN